MCLLHTHNADTKLSDEWIKDFYIINPDGIGVMYSENDEAGVPRLVVKKFLPKTAADAVQIYNENIKGRDCAVHWRMATHGDIDMVNCHPYEVVGYDQADPIYFMHNGVLSNGNWKDKSKSDTWWYAHDYLKPLLDPSMGGDPNLAFKAPFKEILGDSIGSSNKFVLMDRFGNMAIINEDAGVHWNGMWLSNTYAWSAPRRVKNRSALSNKYYAAATRGDDKHDPSLDWMDVPEDDWADYRSYSQGTYMTGSGTTSSGAGTTGMGKSASVTPIGKKSKKQKRKNKNALVPAASGKATDLTALDRMHLQEEKEVDEMFELLDDENKPKAYTSLSFQNFYKFIDTLDLDQCWEAVYMLVDGVIDEVAFIDYILDPQKWNDSKPRVAAKTNVSGGEVDPALADHIIDPDDEEIFGNEAGSLTEEQRAHLDSMLTRAFPEDHPSEDEVIEATLPRGLGVDRLASVTQPHATWPYAPTIASPTNHTATQGIIPIGNGELMQPATAASPIIDARQSANIFDTQSGQRVG